MRRLLSMAVRARVREGAVSAMKKTDWKVSLVSLSTTFVFIQWRFNIDSRKYSEPELIILFGFNNSVMLSTNLLLRHIAYKLALLSLPSKNVVFSIISSAFI